MDQQTLDTKIRDLVAHKAPEELARDLLLAQEQNQKLQTDNDNFLFDKQRVEQESAAQKPAAHNLPANEGDEDDDSATKSKARTHKR